MGIPTPLKICGGPYVSSRPPRYAPMIRVGLHIGNISRMIDDWKTKLHIEALLMMAPILEFDVGEGPTVHVRL